MIVERAWTWSKETDGEGGVEEQVKELRSEKARKAGTRNLVSQGSDERTKVQKIE